ncbi:MarR family transcriptional regulator [Microbacterium sp. EYE_5]|nr:MarR family transcriptional regulator [Microbacterium sp. EYE_382]MCK6085541.1 MarR family transcriptional regulator [Microbacterium sp. EYE_384]MCK6122234.1 MarR family transcriptional regulator [Microbacterium sp. EYE_80]MCK6126304.1 MarR family transcriptional regulator [Microbacterium sp. EYE_79]MCK6141225.1 MarR family transcriptional regulator [Microbacterium sp. EYE_39]MCK6217951.1 MarR family transcriptional regulator [Microbacterium sp. EYE_5]MCK6226565.1 MarR family transcription
MGMMSVESDREARTQAVRALEGEFSDLITQFRRRITENANRVSPGMLPGAYKVFTTIVRHEPITQSALAEMLVLDKGQLSRTVRELTELDLIERTPDPNDGRSSLLTSTAHGRDRLAEARIPQEGALLRALEDWRVEDIENLSRLLHALVAGARPDEEATA